MKGAEQTNNGKKVLPLWLTAIRIAKARAWGELTEKERSEATAAMAAWRKTRKDKKGARQARMRIILARYYAGQTADEIAVELGMTAKSVIAFACDHGLLITRGSARFRSFAFNPQQEIALRKAAEDYGSTAMRILEDAIDRLLFDDAHVIRRLLHVERKAAA